MTTPLPQAGLQSTVDELCCMAVSALCRMYLPDKKLFCFTVKPGNRVEVFEGISDRYTAITLLTLAGYDRSLALQILAGHQPEDVCASLIDRVRRSTDLGAVALTLWAARALRHPKTSCVLDQLKGMAPDRGACPTVEVAWSLTALTVPVDSMSDPALADRVAGRLLSTFCERSGLFAHCPPDVRRAWLRRHVSCYADFVYPIQALAWYYRSTGNERAISVARKAAGRMCELQGPDGQWWWHYDVRTGEVIEPYPVYAVHQHAMGPMALHDLRKAGFDGFGRAIARGLQWLVQPPEIDHSLIDRERGIIWRKVFRSEVRKLARTLHAGTSRVYHGLRMPGIDKLFPPMRVDCESRPYEMAWMLYAWRGQPAPELPADTRVRDANGHTCLCGVSLDKASMAGVVNQVENAIATRRSLTISVVNVAKAVNMRRDALLRRSVVSGDVIIADGTPLVWLSRLKGQPLPQRVAGIDLMFRIFDLADRHQHRVFLLGAASDTLARVVEIARREYPGMIIAGYRNGYFTDAQQEEVAREIRDARPDVLLLAMTSPKKELFMERWGSFLDVPVVHGVGGSFDVMAGVTRRAPQWMQRVGMEWFYRLMQEPRRMWRRYLGTNLRFLAMAPFCILCRHECGDGYNCIWVPKNGNGSRRPEVKAHR